MAVGRCIYMFTFRIHSHQISQIQSMYILVFICAWLLWLFSVVVDIKRQLSWQLSMALLWLSTMLLEMERTPSATSMQYTSLRREIIADSHVLSCARSSAINAPMMLVAECARLTSYPVVVGRPLLYSVHGAKVHGLLGRRTTNRYTTNRH